MEGTDKLIVTGIITFIILLTPLFFIAFDFWAGVRKAKLRGETITSDGWQRTVAKIARYYNGLLALLVIDVIQMSVIWILDTYHSYNIPLIPLITFIGAACVGAIEVKSIMEPANEKEKKQGKAVLELAAEIAKAKADPKEIAQAIAEYLKKEG